MAKINSKGKPIILMGIGQSLRGDDAAGLKAVRLWEESYPEMTPVVQVEYCELPGLHLLDLLNGFQAAILVDAVRSGSTPGTIHLLNRKELAGFTQSSGSTHGWGIAETLSLGAQINSQTLPEKLIIIGIEAGQMAIGTGLGSEVEQAVEEVTSLIQTTIQKLIP